MAIGTTAAIIGATVASTAISAGVSVAGQKAQAKAAKQAAAAQTAAVNSTLDLQKFIYDTQRADTSAWREVGETALGAISEGYPEGIFDPSKFDFEADPGFQFRRDEGEKAINRLAAAKGNRFSGATMKDLTRFNSGLAAQEYQTAWNRNAAEKATNFNQLAALANIGQTGVAQVNQAGQQFAANSGNALMAGGNAQANALLRQGNATAGMYQGLAGAANQGIQNALLFNMLGSG